MVYKGQNTVSSLSVHINCHSSSSEAEVVAGAAGQANCVAVDFDVPANGPLCLSSNTRVYFP